MLIALIFWTSSLLITAMTFLLVKKGEDEAKKRKMEIYLSLRR